MNSRNPILFLLEDCPTTALIIERAVMCEIPDVRVLWARNLTEATARVEGLDIDLFLVDIGLPDGSGLDFLWRMAMQHPEARAIVMTASPLPEHEMHTAALGVLYFLEKPVQPRQLVEQIRFALNKGPADEATEDFQASLKNVTPADILQLKCLTAATTIAEFVSDEKVGRVRFEDGEITDAAMGNLRGVDALYEILAWKHGQVTEHSCTGFFERTIHAHWQSLLMDAAHRIDQARAADV